jgi:hypothetical protein
MSSSLKDIETTMTEKIATNPPPVMEKNPRKYYRSPFYC